MKPISKTLALIGLSVLTACTTNSSQQKTMPSALVQYEDSISKIIAQMTLEEKVNMLHGKNMFSSAGVERLGIPDIEYADGPFGIREEMEPHSWTPLGWSTDSATFFPTGSALAATWSKEMAYQYGVGMATEARLRGKDMILGPAINIQRIPTGGRTYEYFSEDPLLSSVLAVGYTRGVQDQGVAACLKHYALNNQEDYRGTVDVRVSERAMHELYLPPFEAAVKEGDAYGVMAAYNKVDSVWCSENDVLLNQILRNRWGFKGIVISDWGGTHSTVAAAKGGLDVEMPNQRFFGQALLDSVKSGSVPMDVIDQKVRNLLRVRMAIQPIPREEANKQMTSQPKQQKIAYEVARRSIVLLKNEGLLPIDTRKYKRIAVIGDNAIRPQGLGGVGAGVKALYEITPLQGLQQQIGEETEIVYAQGYPHYGGKERHNRIAPQTKADPDLLKEAVAVARNADLVIYMAGNNRDVETEGSDRKSITLPMGQDELAEALAAANPNLVTVVVSGAPVDLNVIKKVSPAIVLSWFNGSEGGNALAEILLGKTSPSGKLPFTFPVKLEDVPAYSLGVYPQKVELPREDIFENLVGGRRNRHRVSPIAHYSEDILVGYRWYDTKQVPVMYPFGHGLSYTTFAYSDMTSKLQADGNVAVSFKLSNTGSVPAEEVVQLYVSRPNSAILRPARELKDFQRVALAPGETKTVQMLIPQDRFRHWDEGTSDWQIEKGTAELLLGSSSQDIRLKQEIEIR